jgi:hypothetical protein
MIGQVVDAAEPALVRLLGQVEEPLALVEL